MGKGKPSHYDPHGSGSSGWMRRKGRSCGKMAWSQGVWYSSPIGASDSRRDSRLELWSGPSTKYETVPFDRFTLPIDKWIHLFELIRHPASSLPGIDANHSSPLPYPSSHDLDPLWYTPPFTRRSPRVGIGLARGCVGIHVRDIVWGVIEARRNLDRILDAYIRWRNILRCMLEVQCRM